jgi:hypothetical protein
VRFSLTMRDREIRGAVKNSLLAQFLFDPDTLIVEELGLQHGAGRVDIAVINGELHGYELKSDQDTLRRLPAQIQTYNSVFDRLTLVVTPHHLDRAIEIAPVWWGVVLAENWGEAGVHFGTVRACGSNPSVSNLATAKLLWRDEALQLLEERGFARGMRSKPRGVIYSRVVELFDLPELQASVRKQLRSRKGWRSA